MRARVDREGEREMGRKEGAREGSSEHACLPARPPGSASTSKPGNVPAQMHLCQIV